MGEVFFLGGESAIEKVPTVDGKGGEKKGRIFARFHSIAGKNPCCHNLLRKR